MSLSGIVRLRQELKSVPDLHSLRMTYEDGGKTEVWSTCNKTVRVRSGARTDEIRAAFEGPEGAFVDRTIAPLGFKKAPPDSIRAWVQDV